MTTTPIQRLPGTRDFYPEDLRLRSWLFGKMRAVSERFGYEEYDGPFLEPYELFAAKSGEQLVAEEMYTMTDRGGRLVGIRPEMTPTLARMVAQRQRELRKPIKWFAIPSLWRYERPQKGRVREHWQWNVDVFGVPGVEAEAEIIAVFTTFLREVGLSEQDFRVRIGHRGWLGSELSRLGIDTAAHLQVLRAIDRRQKLPPAEFQRQLADAGLSPEQTSGLTELLDARDYGASASLRELFELLEIYGVADCCEFDPGIVRGLAYYTSTVFEIWDARRELRAVAGGGRYDDLTVALGGDAMPGVGMAMGDVVLAILLKQEGKLPSLGRELDAFVACYSPAENAPGIALAKRLREAGLRVDRALQPASLSRQMRQAEAVGARTAIILAPDELGRGEAVVRDLRSGEQQSVPLADVESVVRLALAQGTSGS